MIYQTNQSRYKQMQSLSYSRAHISNQNNKALVFNFHCILALPSNLGQGWCIISPHLPQLGNWHPSESCKEQLHSEPLSRVQLEVG